VDAAGLVYVVSDRDVRAVVVRGGERRQYLIGSLTAVSEVDELRAELARPAALASGNLLRLARFMQGWGRRLIPSDLLASPPEVLVLVPHAIVHDLPLHLVLDDAGHPLGTVTGCCYASSLALFDACVRRNPARGAGAAGRPGTGAVARMEVVVADVLAESDEQFRRLADQLRQDFRGEVRVGTDGTRLSAKARFFGNEEPTNVVCVIAHGYVDLQDHKLSGLLLAADQGMSRFPVRVGGRSLHLTDLPLREPPLVPAPVRPAHTLTAADLEMRGISATDLVALLGCSAGLGRTLVGDEPASVAESFLHIGTASVIAPLWDTDVHATGDWMGRFFGGWRGEGLSKAVAARDATRAMHADGWRPEHYGALTLRGDWV
jgi:hypothetical protein